MRMDLRIQLRHLKCLQPEESTAEPFAWPFFFSLDGTNIVQSRVNADRLISTVVVNAPSGSHGNLGVDESPSGPSPPPILIPPGLGTFETSLRPIRISFGGLNLQIPGRAGCFFVLLDEDKTSDHDIEVAHQKLIGRIQLRLNEFVQGISLSELSIAAGQLRAERPALDLSDAAVEVLQASIDAFIDALVDECSDYVAEVVEDESNIIQLIVNWIDSDDLLGSFQYIPDERTMLASSLSSSFVGQVRYKPTDWRYVYDIGVSATAHLVPGSQELSSSSALISKVVGSTGEIITEGQAICVANGTHIAWKRYDLSEQWNFDFDYPFVDVVWSIDGVDLPPGPEAGVLQLTKTVRYARTDVPPSGLRMESRTEERTVEVKHTRARTQGVERLTVFNRPLDGQYSLAIGLSVLLPNGARIPVPPSAALFDGQTIELDPEFMRAYQKCRYEFDNRGRRSKRVLPWELWGPHGRAGILDHVTQELAVVAELRGLSRERRAAMATAAAKQLGIVSRR